MNEEAQNDQPSQTVEEIMRIVQEARTPGLKSKGGEQAGGGGSLDGEDVEADEEEYEVDASGDYNPTT